jgi:hypothetical protein
MIERKNLPAVLCHPAGPNATSGAASDSNQCKRTDAHVP